MRSCLEQAEEVGTMSGRHEGVLFLQVNRPWASATPHRAIGSSEGRPTNSSSDYPETVLGVQVNGTGNRSQNKVWKA